MIYKILQKPYSFLMCVGYFVCIGCLPNNHSQVVSTKNIVYKQTSADANLTSMDVYRTKHAENLPVILYVHGGAWAIGDKSYSEDMAKDFASLGFVFVSVNYRLTPDVQHPVHVMDVASAIAYTKLHIAEYGGDSTAIFLMGHSAGAHLVALVATDDSYLQVEGVNVETINGVIPVDCRLYDLRNTDERDAFQQSFIKNAIGQDSTDWADASPILYVNSSKNLPDFLIFGARTLSLQQAEDFANALNLVGENAEAVSVLSYTHESIRKALGETDEKVTQDILAFIHARL